MLETLVIVGLGNPLRDCAQVHWLLNELGIVVQAHLLPLDGSAEVHALATLHDRFDELVALALHGLVHRIQDEGAGLCPFVAVPSLCGGRAGEGVRIFHTRSHGGA